MERRPINSTKIMIRSVIALACVMALCGAPNMARAAEWGQLDQMHNYHACFGLDSSAKSFSWKITMLDSSAPGNVFHEGELPRFTFQIENLSGEPLQASGKINMIRYRPQAGHVQGLSGQPAPVPRGRLDHAHLDVGAGHAGAEDRRHRALQKRAGPGNGEFCYQQGEIGSAGSAFKFKSEMLEQFQP